MERMLASGRFHVLCYDENGDLKWEEGNSNLVVNTGIQYMAGTALTSVTQITTWYIGLVTGPGSGTTFAAGDTMASHAGWTEFTGYSQATRVTPTFATATTANPSVVTNSASVAVFSINAGGTVAGAFLTSGSAKSGTSGTLFSGSDFTGGDRTVVNGDTLNVTYTFSLTAT
jgi:hypothetical protein